MPGWMQHKLESGLPRDLSKNHKYVDDTTLMVESEEELKSLLMKEEEWKSWLKAQHSEN